MGYNKKWKNCSSVNFVICSDIKGKAETTDKTIDKRVVNCFLERISQSKEHRLAGLPFTGWSGVDQEIASQWNRTRAELWELGYVFKVITVAYRNVLLSLAGFHFFCSLEGEFIFLNPELSGYPGEFLSSTGLNCLLISETVCSVAKTTYGKWNFKNQTAAKNTTYLKKEHNIILRIGFWEA